jgi:hypothetical protein
MVLRKVHVFLWVKKIGEREGEREREIREREREREIREREREIRERERSERSEREYEISTTIHITS